MQYQHGGSPQSDLARFGLKTPPILDFSVNLNFLGPPPIIKQRWMEFFDCIVDYPDMGGRGVKGYYEKKFRIAQKNILPGNGSTELIYLLPRVLGLKKVVIIIPSYHDYARASRQAGAQISYLPLTPDHNFAFPEQDKMTVALQGSDALWCGRPNNPTGNLFSRQAILDLADKFPQKWFIIDEAFIQFVGNYSETSLLSSEIRPNLLILNSLTKFYAMAGIRLGGVIGHEDIITRLRRIKEPWSINGIADRLCYLLPNCFPYEDKTRTLINQARMQLEIHLEKIEGIKFFPSAANFILCQWNRTDNLDHLLRHLLINGLYVRDCRNFTGLENNFFRICIRSLKDNNLLINALASFSIKEIFP